MPKPKGWTIAEDDDVVAMILDLKAARLREGWSQSFVAGQLGVTQQSVAGWEALKTAPSPHTLARWGRLFYKQMGWGT